MCNCSHMSNAPIVVATDFSEQASYAISHAAIIARARNAELVLVHAMSMPSAGYDAPYSFSVPEGYMEMAHGLREESKIKLDKEKKRLEGLGLVVSARCEPELPGHAIVDVATSLKADLIIMGSHGRTGVAHFLIGSVAVHVARHAPCDVLVARSAAPDDGYHRILVPTDFSEVGEAILSQAVSLVTDKGDIELLHCWELPVIPINYLSKTDFGLSLTVRSAVEERGQEWAKKFSTDQVSIRFLEERGDARHVIEEHTKNNAFDLVVMGSHHRKGIQRVLLGSVAETTLRHISTSVYIGRPAAE